MHSNNAQKSKRKIGDGTRPCCVTPCIPTLGLNVPEGGRPAASLQGPGLEGKGASQGPWLLTLLKTVHSGPRRQSMRTHRLTRPPQSPWSRSVPALHHHRGVPSIQAQKKPVLKKVGPNQCPMHDLVRVHEVVQGTFGGWEGDMAMTDWNTAHPIEVCVCVCVLGCVVLSWIDWGAVRGGGGIDAEAGVAYKKTAMKDEHLGYTSGATRWQRPTRQRSVR